MCLLKKKQIYSQGIVITDAKYPSKYQLDALL